MSNNGNDRYPHHLKRLWKHEGEQWDIDATGETAEVLHEQVGGALSERQQNKQAVPDGGVVDGGGEHIVEGVAEETVTKCPDTADQYGPGASDEAEPNYCPYCGEVVRNDDHRVEGEVSEVFCENTAMSTWRFCPGCGDRTDEETDHDSEVEKRE